MNPPQFESSTAPTLNVSRCDRWQARERLQSLSIPCHCSADGRLVVEVNSPLAIIQIRSVIQQLTASRAELITGLEDCWHKDYTKE